MLDFYFYQYHTILVLNCLNNIIYYTALRSNDGFWFDLVFNVCYYFLFHRSIFFTGSKDIKEWRLWPEKNKHCLPVCLSFFLVFRFWKKGLRESPRSSSRSARDAFRWVVRLSIPLILLASSPIAQTRFLIFWFWFWRCRVRFSSSFTLFLLNQQRK